MATGCKSRARREGIRKRREGVERESRSSNRGEGGAPSTLLGVRHRFDGLSSSLRRLASGTLPGVACGRKNMTRHLRRHWRPAAAPHPSPCRWVESASPRLRCRPLFHSRRPEHDRPRIFASFRMDQEAGDARTDLQSDG
jgi:hypothetical protein